MEGHSLNLECHVTGISKPFLRWKRLSKEGYIANGTNLNLKNLKLGDTGIYVCVAETEEGEKMASVSVVVKSKLGLLV